MSATLDTVRRRLAEVGDVNLARFAGTLFERADDPFLAAHDAAALDGMARQGLSFLDGLGRSELRVRVFDPGEADGWRSPYTVVMLALADRPFIVDSVQTELRRRGKALFHQLHPILSVTRDADGRITAIGEPDGRLEAFEIFFLEREEDPAEHRALEEALTRVLHDVILATDDYREMLRRSVEVEEYLRQLAADGVTGPLAVPPEEVAEYAAFMEWLDDDNFVFLGYRAYELVEVGDVPSLQVHA
ncbi:MAG: NAD-glutamate dehydrogenase, partial [Deinococcales bacterium]|nr:NAD-glutamate dehydrogenase [Deinococcales bacterium]